MIAVFDTNMVIDALKGIQQAEVEYQRYENILISIVTWMEVLVGDSQNETQTRDFMSRYFQIIPIGDVIAENAIQIRRNYRLRLPDAIIFATAETYHALLVTRNSKDFKPNWKNVRIPYFV